MSPDVDWVQAADRGQNLSSGFTGVVELNLLLDGLAADRREALVLTQVLGLGYAEAAEVVRVPDRNDPLARRAGA